MCCRESKWEKAKDGHWLWQNVGHWLYLLSFVIVCQLLEFKFLTDTIGLTWIGDLTIPLASADGIISLTTSWELCGSKDWQYLPKKVELLLVEDGCMWQKEQLSNTMIKTVVKLVGKKGTITLLGQLDNNDKTKLKFGKNILENIFYDLKVGKVLIKWQKKLHGERVIHLKCKLLKFL